MAANSPPLPSPSQLPPVPASPTFSYASTANPLSQYNLPPPPPPRPPHAVLTKADLENSQTAYADLLSSAKAYRLALGALSTAASAFGSALESCARLKEARADALPGGPPPSSNNNNNNNNNHSSTSHHHHNLSNSFTAANQSSTCTADALLTTAGLQHLIANHQHILSETVYRAFEVPLLHELDQWQAAVDDEQERYMRALSAQSTEIRRLEKEGVKLHRQRRRDVGKLRAHLVDLTTKLDGLTVLHGEHARTLLRESQDTSVRIVEAGCSLVRAEVDIFESLARKGWTGGGLEDVLEKGVDLFAAEMDPLGGGGGGPGRGGGGGGGDGMGAGDGTTLFSILPPKSILADTSGTETIRAGKETRSDSLLVDTDRYQSLVGAVSSDHAREKDRDTDSVFSEFNRSRNVRPFSPQPQPLRSNPEELFGSLEDGGAAESSSGSRSRARRPGHDGVRECEDGCVIEEDDRENYNDDPWRNEGLRDGTSSDEEGQDKVGASLGDPQQREETWSVTDDTTT
ncbi:hypothetical protein C8A00DRAFT_32037 [Chaetomidium leptoderma]|uniref:Protein IVY1 n=1 Tax=Chaetomidium leptoderma TaxID=669021 RepID=A0AAN6VPG1_9PEZI|nr:hypothetical protein C8A00DRAFT_32037 [Chaetomidium leptoderma]